jgi:hypothetical protein
MAPQPQSMFKECEFVISQGVAYCPRCGRRAAAPNGRVRGICRPKLPPGPGTELKALLKTIGIVASPTCKCNKMARQMDAWGPDESLAHMEEIVDVMEATARKRKLPFLRAAAKQMVRLACWRARRKARAGH